MGYRLAVAACFGAILCAAVSGQDAKKRASPEERVITGTVVDQAGMPVNGADIGLQVWRYDRETRLPNGDFASVAQTAADGTFRLVVPEGLDPSLQQGTVWAIAEGQVPQSSTSTLKRHVSHPVKLKLVPAVETIVRVLDIDQRPAPGVRVRVLSQRGRYTIGFPFPPPWREGLTGTTNDRGDAWIEHVLPDAIDGILISRDGMADVRLDPNFFLNRRPAKSGPTFTVILPSTGSILGQFTAEDAGVRLRRKFRVQTRSEEPVLGLTIWGEKEVESDDVGHFRIDGIAAGRVTVPPFLPPQEPWRAMVPLRVAVMPSETLTLRIPLVRGVSVRGQLRKGDTKEGAPDNALTLIYGHSAEDNSSMLEKFELTTDRDGFFTAIVPPGAIQLRLQGSPEGYCNVDWWKPNRKGSYGVGMEVPAGVTSFELAPVDFDRTRELKGRLVDRDGAPLHDWTVYGYPDIPGREPDSVMNSFPGVQSDQDGTFAGTHPMSYPPTAWKVSYREWTTPFEFEDRKFPAQAISQDPLVLRVDVRKADLKDARKNP
ncbi:hypothetical protein Pan44_43470 [Caulifigura coniformis]|uniref:Nickel uptake substrate-specific transmembrane region n=1 Tax=Caulifigura coniformis TaxID=2527983 RepID=A0A517SJJ1_9PLAN|nr:hypothetical protein [Caulifigura coniformis]QDT56294.1 hypothetical protein Pan44_43470 [Caulifigura coniformis]